MTHNTARNWAITLGITSALALTGCTASNGAATPTSSDTTTHSTAPPPSGGTATSTAGSTAPSATSPAGSVAPSATQPGDSGTTAPSTPSAPDASSEPVGAPGATTAPAEPAPGDQTGDTIALTETYTAPNGTYTVNYPASWTATTDKGYLQLTSPDGTVTGHVAPTSLHRPDAAWTGRQVSNYSEQTARGITDTAMGRVSAYAGYNSAADPAQDSVGWGLSQPVPSSLVSMAGVGSSDELWAYFQQSGVNTTGKPLNDAQAAEVTHDAVTSTNGATVAAILHSVQLHQSAGDPTGDPTGDPVALTETYTAPDGAFSMKYPASWTAKTDQGYLELTSPTGQATGRIATTDVRPLREDWFTSPRYTVPGETTQLSEDIGAQVSTYSAYLRSDKGPDEDTVLFGLSQVNSSGLVSLAGGETGRELWVEFSTGPVNTTGRFVTDEELVDILDTTVATHPDVPAIQAMLHSISMD